MMAEFMFIPRARTFNGKIFMLFSIIAILLGIGTFVYHFAEGWSYVDSLYFSSISLTTRGYGELHPTTTFSKLFTVFYLFLGVVFVIYSLSSLIGHYIQYKEPAITKKVDNIMNSFSPPKKDKWVVIKTPESGNAGPKQKIKF